MENITMTKTTQITRVLFACPQAADHSLIVGVGGAFYAPNHTALAVKDAARFRSGRPLI